MCVCMKMYVCAKKPMYACMYGSFCVGYGQGRSVHVIRVSRVSPANTLKTEK
jgi:hypothetical protein